MLRKSTIANSRNRRRFVTDAAAQPYLRHRERMNAFRPYRQDKALIAELANQSVRGTEQALFVARKIAALAERLLVWAEAVAANPTPGEATARAITNRLAAD